MWTANHKIAVVAYPGEGAAAEHLGGHIHIPALDVYVLWHHVANCVGDLFAVVLLQGGPPFAPGADKAELQGGDNIANERFVFPHPVFNLRDMAQHLLLGRRVFALRRWFVGKAKQNAQIPRADIFEIFPQLCKCRFV